VAQEAKNENDRERDRPHGHLVGMTGRESSRPEHGRYAGPASTSRSVSRETATTLAEASKIPANSLQAHPIPLLSYGDELCLF